MRRILISGRSSWLFVLLLLSLLGACGKKSEENATQKSPIQSKDNRKASKSEARTAVPPTKNFGSGKLPQGDSRTAISVVEPGDLGRAGSPLKVNAVPPTSRSIHSGSNQSPSNATLDSAGSIGPTQAISEKPSAIAPVDPPIIARSIPVDHSTFPIVNQSGSPSSGALITRPSFSGNGAPQNVVGSSAGSPVKLGNSGLIADRSSVNLVAETGAKPEFKPGIEPPTEPVIGNIALGKKEIEDQGKILPIQSSGEGIGKKDDLTKDFLNADEAGEAPNGKIRLAANSGILSSQPDQEMMGDLLNYLLAPPGITFSGHPLTANGEYHAKAGETHFPEARIDFSTPSEDGQGFVEDPNWAKECQGKIVRVAFLGLHQKNYGEPLPFISALRSGNIRDLKKVVYQDYPIQAGCKIYPTDFTVNYDGMYAFFLVPEGQARIGGVQSRDLSNPKELADFDAWMGNPEFGYVRFNFVAKTVLNLDSNPAGGQKAKAVPLF